jgi:hypothetical protein
MSSFCNEPPSSQVLTFRTHTSTQTGPARRRALGRTKQPNGRLGLRAGHRRPLAPRPASRRLGRRRGTRFGGRRACRVGLGAAFGVPPSLPLPSAGQGRTWPHQAAPQRPHHSVSRGVWPGGSMGGRVVSSRRMPEEGDPSVAVTHVATACFTHEPHPPPPTQQTSFLKEHSAVATLISDFLCVKDRLRFLHTHKCVRAGAA